MCSSYYEHSRLLSFCISAYRLDPFWNSFIYVYSNKSRTWRNKGYVIKQTLLNFTIHFDAPKLTFDQTLVYAIYMEVQFNKQIYRAIKLRKCIVNVISKYRGKKGCSLLETDVRIILWREDKLAAGCQRNRPSCNQGLSKPIKGVPQFKPSYNPLWFYYNIILFTL